MTLNHYFRGSGLRAVILRGLTGSAGLRVVGMGFALLVGIQLARGMGPQGYGIYGLAMSIVAILMVPTEFGLPQLVVRETAASAARSRWGDIRGIINWSRDASLISSVLVAVLVIIVLVAGGRYIDQPLSEALLVGLLMIPCVALTKTRGAALRGLKHIVKGQIPDTVLRPGTQSLILFFAASLALTLTPALAMLTGVVGAAFAYLASNIMLRRALPSEAKSAQRVIRVKEWRSSCIPMAMTEAMRILQGHLAVLVLGLLAAAESIGIYKVATAIALVVTTPTAIFVSVAAPLISSLHTSEDRIRLQRLLSWTTAGMVGCTALLSAPFFFAAPVAINLIFGGDFVEAAIPLQILCAGALLTASAGTAGTLLNMTGHEICVRRASLQSLVLLLALLPPLIWYGGPSGAACATVIASLLWRARMVRDCRRIIGLDPGLSGYIRLKDK
ncbi:lipopolysaccharide biosynthesis protein [Luteimonas fraxinea]|uniref:lipopolysaccharide biosynthesis protein n=1 Tax=Luteimonas fraxinea TaxID=2901869 RepID=UPI002E12CD83